MKKVLWTYQFFQGTMKFLGNWSCTWNMFPKAKSEKLGPFLHGSCCLKAVLHPVVKKWWISLEWEVPQWECTLFSSVTKIQPHQRRLSSVMPIHPMKSNTAVNHIKKSTCNNHWQPGYHKLPSPTQQNKNTSNTAISLQCALFSILGKNIRPLSSIPLHN